MGPFLRPDPDCTEFPFERGEREGGLRVRQSVDTGESLSRITAWMARGLAR